MLNLHSLSEQADAFHDRKITLTRRHLCMQLALQSKQLSLGIINYRLAKPIFFYLKNLGLQAILQEMLNLQKNRRQIHFYPFDIHILNILCNIRVRISPYLNLLNKQIIADICNLLNISSRACSQSQNFRKICKLIVLLCNKNISIITNCPVCFVKDKQRNFL